MPAYTPNVPQAAQTIASSQNQILQNFIQIETWTNVDHVQISGAGGNEGKHAKVSLIEQPYVAGGNFTPAINAATGVGTLGIYAARQTDNLGPSRMWAVIPRQIAGPNYTTFNVPFTQSSLLTNAPGGTGGYTYLPSGLILQWGTFTLPIANTTTFVTDTIIYTTYGGITFPNAAINVLVTSVADSSTAGGAVVVASAQTTALPTDRFDVTARAVFQGSPGTTNSRSFRYLAIGY